MARKRTVTPPPSRFSEGYESVKAKLQENTERLKQLQGQAHAKMSENPVQTAAVAFGIGVVIGVGLKMIIDSKRR